MAEPGRVLIWVQHLLGIGHLMRAAHIARELAQRGWNVHLVSGGVPVPGLDVGRAQFHQIPALKAADADFSGLADPAGRPATAALMSARVTALLQIHDAAQPDFIVVEHYPFGRRQLRAEIGALLAAGRAAADPPVVLASIRDILVERKVEREQETLAALKEEFAGVLVHGDPALVTLDESFRRAARITRKIAYTGYVGGTARGPEPPAGDGANEIVVSAGGGAVGAALARTALAAAATMPHVRRWRILVGAQAGAAEIADLRAKAPSWVIVEPARPDFRGLLRRCAASISQAGYNTVVDVLASGCRAVIVPFAAGRETEQSVRAACLARRGWARVLPESALSPEKLAAAVADAMATPKPRTTAKLDGEAETARLMAKMLAARRGEAAA